MDGSIQEGVSRVQDTDSVRVVIPPLGAKFLGSATSTDYRIEQGLLQKRKVRVLLVCARGDQQAAEINDAYSLVTL